MRATTAGASSVPLPFARAHARAKTSSGDREAMAVSHSGQCGVADLGVEEAQVVGDLGHRRHRRVRARARGPLLQRDRRRHAGHAIDVGPRQRGEELARVGRERLEEAALALGEDHVEREVLLPEPLGPVTTTDLAVGDGRRDLAQVVLAGVDDLDGRAPRVRLRRGRRRRSLPAIRPRIAAQRQRASALPVRVSRLARSSSGVPLATTAPAVGAGAGAEVDDPVGARG